MVTGATRGIGKETALAFARMNATVVMTARDQTRGEAAVADVIKRSGNQHVELLMLDLADLASIRVGATTLLAEHDRIHILVNNAGTTTRDRRETADGFELTFGTNHLGHFLFTNLLLDRIKESAPARIVNVSSGAHRWPGAGLDFDDLQATHGYRGGRAYGRSKLANILFTIELADRLRGTGVTANAVHPGLVATNFGGAEEMTGAAGLAMRAVRPMMRTATEGADTSIYVATAPELEGVTGEYFAARKPARRSKAARDRVVAARLWDVSEDLVSAGSPSAD